MVLVVGPVSDTGSVVVGGAIGATATVLGVAITALIQLWRERGRLKLDSAIELADLGPLMANENGYYELQAALHRLDARLSRCGVPTELRKALRDTTIACWRNNATGIEQHDQPGFDSTLLELRSRVVAVVRGLLLQSMGHNLRSKADVDKIVNAVGEALPPPSQGELDSELFL